MLVLAAFAPSEMFILISNIMAVRSLFSDVTDGIAKDEAEESRSVPPQDNLAR